MSGVVRLPDGRWVRGACWPDGIGMYRFIDAAGGNRKRGLMAWAAQLADMTSNAADKGRRDAASQDRAGCSPVPLDWFVE